MDRDFDVLVVGGGAAGLAHAFWRLRRQPQLRLRVLEAAPRAGGWVQTTVKDGFVCERGPQGFRPNADTDAFLDALGIAGEVLPADAAAKRRFLARSGIVHALPGGPGQLLTTRLLTFGDLFRLCKEPWVKKGDDPRESLAGFATRRLGNGVRPLAEAFARGVFAGNAERIEMQAAFPSVFELEQQHGSLLRGLRQKRKQRRQQQQQQGQQQQQAAPAPRQRRPLLCSFPSGMQRSVDALTALLGERLALGTPVLGVERAGDRWQVRCGGAGNGQLRARELVLATPADQTARLLQPLAPRLAGSLAEVPFASVASVFLGARKDAFAPPLDGFGCLQPNGEGPVLGALYCSSIFPRHAPPDMQLLRVMSGGVDFADECRRTDADLQQQALAFARRLLGLRGEPVLLHVERAERAIPQYERGHSERVRDLQQQLQQFEGLQLCGASYRQVSVVGQWAEAGSRP